VLGVAIEQVLAEPVGVLSGEHEITGAVGN